MFVDIPGHAEVRISNTQPELIMFYLNLKDAEGGALCVQVDFTRTFQTNTKCNNISHVWSHFYNILHFVWRWMECLHKIHLNTQWVGGAITKLVLTCPTPTPPHRISYGTVLYSVQTLAYAFLQEICNMYTGFFLICSHILQQSLFSVALYLTDSCWFWISSNCFCLYT